MSASHTMTLRSFLAAHAAQLAATLEARLTPLYDPRRPEGVEAYADRIRQLPRELFVVQAEVAKGLAKALFDGGRRRLFVCGEQGTGKTTLALAVAACPPRPLRMLVVCPGHLVEKWRREAKAVIPNVVTVDLAVPTVISLLDELRRQRGTRPVFTEVYVISKERAKLSFAWTPAVWRKGRFRAPHCPQCGVRASKGDQPLTGSELEANRHRCGACGSALWQADRALRRYAPVEYMKKYLKRFFDLVVLDECHEYKGGDTLQGQAMGSLLGVATYGLLPTGTLNGGYADDLFHLLWRVAPAQLKQDGFAHNSAQEWLRRYGVVETVEDLDAGDDHRYGRGRRRKGSIRRRPGVSPVAIGRYLLDKTVFIRLADVMDGLPPYDERVATFALEGEQAHAYGALEQDLRTAVKRFGKRALAAMLQGLLSYPDSCPLFGEAIPIRDKTGQVVEVCRAPRVTLPEGTCLLKEAALIEWVGQERATGRKVLAYVSFTDKRDLRPRLKEILETAGFRVGILSASVTPKQREAWIAAHQADVDVLLLNPELVKTGLDLYAFPTLIFYQVGYNLYTLRQAARRSWRIGQGQPVKVVFFAYQNTMQATAITLMARKLKEALLVEGDLPEGLAEYGHTQASLIEELGRALMSGRRVRSAAEAWAEFRQAELRAQGGLARSEAATVTGDTTLRTGGDGRITRILVSRVGPSEQGGQPGVVEVTRDELEQMVSEQGAVQVALF